MSLIFSTGIVGVLKENFILVLVWLPLNLLTSYVSSQLFSWIAFLPLMFVALLNAIYAYLLWKGKGIAGDKPPAYAVTDIMTIGGKPVLETETKESPAILSVKASTDAMA